MNKLEPITLTELGEIIKEGQKIFDKNSKNNDSEGRPITEEEPLNKVIQIWEIEPGTQGYDSVWIRSYQDAMAFAQDRVEHLMDGCDNPEEWQTVKMRKISVNLQDYLEVVENDG